MSSKPLVYVAGPYTSPEPIENIHKASKMAVQLIDEGIVTPIVPHCTMIFQLVEPRQDINYWYEYDLEVMKRCDAVLRLPGDSFGSDQEVRKAEEWGIPIFYSVEALYAWANPRIHFMEEPLVN